MSKSVRLKLKKWTVTILVAWSIFRILLFIVKDIIFQYISISSPYDNIVQMASLAVIILLSFILAALLVQEDSL
ncbi:hypothetical protein [Paenibacillus fonticola]|uniref:hypothetical protein n=1 Tax=Paenibacillus fonticola TaxID=379896 RepID=UPI000366EE80|nr:hypothetical protein [Paenibacillus fonticola]